MRRLSIPAILLLTIAAPLAAAEVTGQADCGRSCENFVVFLEGAPAESGEGETAVFDQRDKVFIPHVLPVLKGTTVEIKNGDPFLHNVHVYDGKETVLNIALPFQGQVIPHTFSEAGSFQVLCDAHPEMSAFIVVLDTPYFATPEADGSYRIPEVPPGSYTLVVHDAESGRQSRSELAVQ